MIRDLAKSMISFSWGMSLFGVKQSVNLLTPQSPSQPTHKATAAFNSVTQATEEQLGGTLKGVFKAGDQLQKGMVDMMSSCLTLEIFNPSQMMRMTSDMMKQATGGRGQRNQENASGSQQQSSGFGPVPSPSSTPRPQPQQTEGWGPIPAESNATGS